MPAAVRPPIISCSIRPWWPLRCPSRATRKSISSRLIPSANRNQATIWAWRNRPEFTRVPGPSYEKRNFGPAVLHELPTMGKARRRKRLGFGLDSPGCVNKIVNRSAGLVCMLSGTSARSEVQTYSRFPEERIAESPDQHFDKIVADKNAVEDGDDGDVGDIMHAIDSAPGSAHRGSQCDYSGNHNEHCVEQRAAAAQRLIPSVDGLREIEPASEAAGIHQHVIFGVVNRKSRGIERQKRDRQTRTERLEKQINDAFPQSGTKAVGWQRGASCPNNQQQARGQ